ncbi:MAG: hypothetical protein A3E85_01940 [Gammaproteobacteria bacterium RIFCSPHIGHO2_12_FULL_45_12]|nr:MAG: hypothetical protein A3E85_01940 [Gammaproteobacteria bacterium RIFCSPHIGHO2_12_FULL_45_12]
MMRVLRIMLSVIGLIVVVGVVAIGSLMFFMDPNKMKPALAKEVMTRTGYQLAIEGDLKWAFYPRFGIQLKRMTLSTPNQAMPFADLQNVSVAMGLWQFLQGNHAWQGEVYIAKARLVNLKAQDAHVGLHWNKNLLTLQPITANLYDGSLEGFAHGSQLSATPHWDWVVQFNHIQLKPLLQAVSGEANQLNVSGVAQVKFNASTEGSEREQLLNNLNGTSSFSVVNGSVEGVDLDYLIQSANALMGKQPAPAQTRRHVTAFDRLSGAWLIKDGMARSYNLTLSTPILVTKGGADVNLLNEALDSKLQIFPQKGATLSWMVPVQVTGSLMRPEVQLDMSLLNKMISRQDIEKIKEKVRAKIKEQIPGKSGELLQQFLG